ncbi:hypothetical protein [Stenoxybacter acetivorans]|uniref:hypothetical protein n=1 Tax=Stenoxybacter acetivorans TaxID=422441 RepID=UPI00056B2139|nr:hypothetical protein [Stenoxybacter acetivorans]
MYTFLLDFFAVIRLRFAPAAHYRYSWAITIAVLAAVSLVNAAAMSPVFGKEPAAIAFSLIFTALKWFVLSQIMSRILHYFGAPRMRLFGFVLLTEALIIPELLMLYWPEIFTLPGIFWQIWIMLVQFWGFVYLSQGISAWKVVIGYLAYLLLIACIFSIISILFNNMGWLDVNNIMQQMQRVAEMKSQ